MVAYSAIELRTINIMSSTPIGPKGASRGFPRCPGILGLHSSRLRYPQRRVSRGKTLSVGQHTKLPI